MHYSSNAFSKNSKRTIESKNEPKQISNPTKLSEIDIMEIRKLYGCKNGNLKCQFLLLNEFESF